MKILKIKINWINLGKKFIKMLILTIMKKENYVFDKLFWLYKILKFMYYDFIFFLKFKFKNLYLNKIYFYFNILIFF